MMRVLLAPAVLLAASCIQGGRTGPVDDEVERRVSLLSLRDGETIREDVLLAYGIPAARFENDRILCYRLRETADGTVVLGREAEPAEPWAGLGGPVYNLILVFDAKSVLQKHRLLCVRQTLLSPAKAEKKEGP